MDRLLSLHEVAARLGIARRTAYDLVSRGDLAHIRLGNVIRVRPEDLAALRDGRARSTE